MNNLAAMIPRGFDSRCAAAAMPNKFSIGRKQVFKIPIIIKIFRFNISIPPDEHVAMNGDGKKHVHLTVDDDEISINSNDLRVDVGLPFNLFV